MQTILMQCCGGAQGVRDPGALEAALYRQQTGYYEDIVAKAAAVLESLAINYPSVDGNKLYAYAAITRVKRPSAPGSNQWGLGKLRLNPQYRTLFSETESQAVDLKRL